MASLCLELKGNIFKEIMDIYLFEQERMKSGDHIIYSKIADIYMKIFKCNPNIKLIKSECFGDIIIDDNHIVIQLDIEGCKVEFYYEQYWDIMDLTISENNSENALCEIAKAFQNYFNKEFSYNTTNYVETFFDNEGKSTDNTICKLIIEDL